jgi:hypothetical protein
LAAAAVALCGVSPAQTTATIGPQVITSPRPVKDVADALEGLYAKPVTYEDPVREWRADMRLMWGKDERAVGAMVPRDRSFRLPAGLGPTATPVLDADLVNRILNSYHAENPDGPRFRVIATSYGLHIVPDQYSDASGSRIAVTPILDTIITVPREKRLPGMHLLAIAQAAKAQSGTDVWEIATDLGFETHFAPNGALCGDRNAPPPDDCFLEWGAAGVSARDALISLFEQSATTMTWQLLCGPVVAPKSGFCVLNIAALMVNAGDPGAPVKRQLLYDRCVKCPPLAAPRPGR